MPYEGFEPKSGCRNWRNESMRAMYVAELGSTDAPEMSWFQGLSAGKTWHPPISGPPASTDSGSGGGVAVSWSTPIDAAGTAGALGPGVIDGGALNSAVGCSLFTAAPTATLEVAAGTAEPAPHAVAESVVSAIARRAGMRRTPT